MRHYAWAVFIVLFWGLTAAYGETAATGNVADAANAGPLPEVNPLKIEGDLVVAGSTSVSPLTKAIYKRFIVEGYRGIMRHYSIGTESGFQLFCDGKSDIAGANRPIEPAEMRACEAQHRSLAEFGIGVGAIVVMVSDKNDFVNNLTLQELTAVFTAKRWSDVNPGWPKQPVELLLPPVSRDILDTLVTKLFDGTLPAQLSDIRNTKPSDNLRLWFHRIGVNPYSIGFSSYTDYVRYGHETNMLYVEGVAPRVETVESGKYRLTQPLFLYADPQVIATKPQVAAFLNFYLTNVNEALLQVGLFPASPETSKRAQAILWQATTEMTSRTSE